VSGTRCRTGVGIHLPDYATNRDVNASWDALRFRLLYLFSKAGGNLIHRVNAVDVIKSWWSRGIASAPSPLT
jgi:hypothetical protein